MDPLQLVTAFGLGAVVTALVQAWLTSRAQIRQRNFQEKKESYLGFLDALHESEVHRTEIAALNVGRWNNRIELVGSFAVRRACDAIRSTNPINGEVHPDRPAALRTLREAMRHDLGVEPRNHES